MRKQITPYLLAFSLAGFFCTGNVLAQTDKATTQEAPKPKASPAATASGKLIGGATVTVNYSSPAVKERKIWGGQVPYGKVWRAGANEATTLETDKDLNVDGKLLPAGKYSIFTIPGEEQWTIIFNKQTGQWGTRYDQSQDLLRVTTTPAKAATFNERLTYEVVPTGLVLRWENLEVPVSLSVNRK